MAVSEADNVWVMRSAFSVLSMQVLIFFISCKHICAHMIAHSLQQLHSPTYVVSMIHSDRVVFFFADWVCYA
jgi:hypothetical protein